MTIGISHATPADGSFSAAGATAWNEGHAVTGLLSGCLVFGSTADTLATSADLSYSPSTTTLRVGNVGIEGAGHGVINMPTSSSTNALSLTVAAQNGETQGGNFYLSGGISQNGTGGMMLLTGGTPVVNGNGGAINLYGGTGADALLTGAAGAGGGVNLVGGNGFGFAGPGHISITAGNNNTNFVGGNVTLAAGHGGVTSGTGGYITITSGNARGSGTGGPVTITSGNGAGTNKDAGNITLQLGAKTGTGTPGRLKISTSGGSFLVTNGTNVVTLSESGPAALTNSIIQGWLPIMVDDLLYYIPLWN